VAAGIRGVSAVQRAPHRSLPNGGRLWILNTASPMVARKTRLLCPLARNFNKEGAIDDVHTFNLQIFNEDRVIIESQRPEDLPIDLRMGAHIPADRPSIAYRKLLKDMGLVRCTSADSYCRLQRI
jgi:vanillate O-demethylase monooxygenase subunit